MSTVAVFVRRKLNRMKAALLMAESLPGTHRVTLGSDKGYDTRDFIAELRHMEITPHVAQNDTNRSSAVDERTTRHVGHQLSQKARKRIEEVFGWIKTVGNLRKTRHRGLETVAWVFTFTATVSAQNPPSSQFVIGGDTAKKIHDFTTINLATAERIAEACERLAIPSQFIGKEFQGDEAVQAGVFRLVHHTHPAAAEFLDDAVVLDCLADHR